MVLDLSIGAKGRLVSSDASAMHVAGLLENASKAFSIIKGPAILFVILELVDGLMTMWATGHGFEEVNPLVASYSYTWLYPLSKVAMALLGVIVMLPVVRRFSGFVKFGFVVASLFITVIILSNLYEVGVSLR